MSKQTAYLMGETVLTPNDRAQIMGGRPRRERERDQEDEENLRLRFVCTGATSSGCPIVVCERETGRDALGASRWEVADLPAPIATAALARVLRDRE